MAARYQALPNDRDLRRFVVQAETTGKTLGTGSYGTVEEVKVNGLLCAGKRIHEILLDDGNVGVREIAAKYVQECQIMSNLRHPNVTLFIGVCFLPNCQLPLLVMERLEGSLDDLLETINNIPLALKLSFLEDTAQGLLYLHKHDPQIIHRDLTAKNVLLTSSLVAKITDLGNSRFVNIQPGQLAQTLSRNPGTQVYMPPEALSATSRYGPSLDIFSFGHLGIFVGLQVFPGDLLEPTYNISDSSDQLDARSEVERRGLYFNRLERIIVLPDGKEHPLVELLKQCLKNNPSQRPTAEQVIASLVEIKADIEGPYGEVAKADAVRHVVMMRALRKRDTEVRIKSAELADKDVVIHQLQTELDHTKMEQTRAEQQLQDVTTETRIQLSLKDDQIQQKDSELVQARTRSAIELNHIKQVLQSERTRTEEQLQQKLDQILQLNNQLQQKITELNNVQQTLQGLRADLEEREAHLRAQEEEMQQRDAEINRLMAELGRCQAQLLRQQVGESGLGDKSAQRSTEEEIKQKPLEELKLPLKLEWKKGEDMPNGMGGHIQSAVIGEYVYVGGRDSRNLATVMAHSLQTGTWKILPCCETFFFGMAVVNNQLVLIGGMRTATRKVTYVLKLWDEKSQSWKQPFPTMPTVRSSLSVISYNNWLITAGGYDGEGYSNKVELLDTRSRKWYEGPALPNGCSEMSSAISGNMWYLSRGFCSFWTNKHVFSVCLDELISRAVSHCASTTSPPTPSPWQTLTELPVEDSTVLIIRGSLLAVGGWKSSAIHLYQPSRRSWVKVSELPAQRWQCACTVLPSGQIFVAGGISGSSLSNSVDIATIF